MNLIVDASERITRYLRNGGHMRTGLQLPHFTAYMPKVPYGDISVYRTVGLSAQEIEAIGAQYVGKPESPLKGHCCLTAGSFFGEGLNVVAEQTRHIRHANVTGWVTDPKNRIMARRLADQATMTAYAPATSGP